MIGSLSPNSTPGSAQSPSNVHDNLISLPPSESAEGPRLELIKKVKQSTYPIFLAYSHEYKQCVALKVFPYKNEGEEIDQSYL